MSAPSKPDKVVSPTFDYVSANLTVKNASFDPYMYKDDKGKADPATGLHARDGARTFITKSEYENTAKAFDELDPKTQAILKSHANIVASRSPDLSLYDAMSPQDRAAFLERVKESGLDVGANTMLIIHDHGLPSEKKHKNIPVYSVNGRPVFGPNMSPILISQYHNISPQDAKKCLANHRAPKNVVPPAPQLPRTHMGHKPTAPGLRM